MEKASSRPIWSGSISFGLVTIPVRLFTAVREKRLHFRTLHDQDKVPLKQKMYCPADGKEVHPEHTVKGYEIEKDRFVVIRQDELDAARPKGTKAIEIQDFVELDDIDPLFFDRPYYVAPKPEGAKPYKLLLEAMETMHFNDEVIKVDTVPGVEVKAKVDDRELKMATQLIDSLTTDFKPQKYKDDYRQEVMALIEKKAAGEEIHTAPTTDKETTGRTRNLMAALEASLAKSRPPSHARTTRRRK